MSLGGLRWSFKFTSAMEELEEPEQYEDEVYEKELRESLAKRMFLLLKDPSNTELKKEFIFLLCQLGKLLEKYNSEDLIDLYKDVLEVFPDAALLNNFGSHLLRFGILNEAASCFRKCLTLDPDFIRAAHNLDNFSCSAIERWHFRMLNDQQRNEAFRKAIIKKINQGFDRVLDVGTGTGILSLCCLEGKAKEIYACECSPIMAETAEQVFLSNNASYIKLIQKESLELKVPEDIGDKLSLLVTETFDVALLGENVLGILSHAWENLLLPPGCQPESLNSDKFGAVIPHKAIVYATGIEFIEVANAFHLKETAGSNLFEDCVVLQHCGSYDSQDLSRARFTCLTETERIFEVSFNDPSAIKEYSKNWCKNVKLNCKCPGRLDCIAVWFDLYLDDDIVLSTSPLTKASGAWDQAIFLLPRSVLVNEKQDLNISVSYENSHLKILLNCFSLGAFSAPVFFTSERTTRMLNDEKLMKTLQQVADKLAFAYGDSINVLDCSSFPVFGLNFLKKRKGRFKDVLGCVVSTKNEKSLLNFLSKKNGFEINSAILKKDDILPIQLSFKIYNLILLDLFMESGEIKDDHLLELKGLKELIVPGGIILPKNIEVIGQFINSDWLTKATKVIDDSVTLGFKIADYINKYQSEEFIWLDLKSLDYVPVCEPFRLFSLFDPLESVTEMTIPCQSDVFANAMVYWFKIKFIDGCDEILTKDLTFYKQAAFVFSKEIRNKEIKFNIIRRDGLFRIKLLNN